jgi:hypothetical protein
MVGVEALLRWPHATRGAIQSTTFIPIPEQMGLMDTIGAFVLHRTLQDAAGSRATRGELFNPSRARIGSTMLCGSAHMPALPRPQRHSPPMQSGPIQFDKRKGRPVFIARINDLHALGGAGRTR